MTNEDTVAADTPVDFDDYHENYGAKLQESIDFAGVEHDFFVRVKAEHLLRTIRTHVGDPSAQQVLDIGCGVGTTDAHLVDSIGELHGADVSAKSIEEARERNSGVGYTAYEPNRLPYDDQQFDVAFAICVMHHVPPADWATFVSEARRVLRPGGLFVVYEHNPWNPATRYAVHKCEFDRDAVLLSLPTTKKLAKSGGFLDVSGEYILFIPRDGAGYRNIESKLTWLPLGAQYCLTCKK